MLGILRRSSIFLLQVTLVDLRRFLGRNNPTGYQNSAIVQLTDQLATADPDELDRIYRALTEVFRADLPVTCLFRLTSTAFAHRRVQGLTTPFHARPDTDMEDLWLDDRP